MTMREKQRRRYRVEQVSKRKNTSADNALESSTTHADSTNY